MLFRSFSVHVKLLSEFYKSNKVIQLHNDKATFTKVGLWIFRFTQTTPYKNVLNILLGTTGLLLHNDFPMCFCIITDNLSYIRDVDMSGQWIFDTQYRGTDRRFHL